MSRATISLTRDDNNKRLVVIWKNISHFSEHDGKTEIAFLSMACLTVKESISEIEQVIEQAARNE